MKRLLALLLSILLLLALCSCGDRGSEDITEEVFFTVTFVTSTLPYDVTPPESTLVKEGESVSRPILDASPTAGYVVIWTKDRETKAAYDFSSAVTESVTLYAVEIPRTYTVTYLIQEGTNHPANITSFTKETETFILKAPSVPFGYRFVKWAYADDPDSVVESIAKGTEHNILLRAVVTPVEYMITYFVPGDTNPNPATYLFGETLTLEAPSRDGYDFIGYTIMGDSANTPVTTITKEFIRAYEDILFRENGTIGLKANWEAKS